MSTVTTPDPQQAPVAYVNTGHPLRDWLAWRIANTKPGQPVFPLLRELLNAIVPILGSALLDHLNPPTNDP
jgi:hypothetical protein